MYYFVGKNRVFVSDVFPTTNNVLCLPVCAVYVHNFKEAVK